jgi:hypothetical protein
LHDAHQPQRLFHMAAGVVIEKAGIVVEKRHGRRTNAGEVIIKLTKASWNR